MTSNGGFRVTNRQSGLSTLKPGQNTGGGVVTQPFIYGVAQVESIIINEEGSGTNIRDDKLAAKTAGRVKIRLLELDQVTRRKDLYESDPLNPYHFLWLVNLYWFLKHWVSIIMSDQLMWIDI